MDKAPYQLVGTWGWLRRTDVIWNDPMLKSANVLRGVVGVFNGERVRRERVHARWRSAHAFLAFLHRGGSRGMVCGEGIRI
jgi:hypothetical protein